MVEQVRSDVPPKGWAARLNYEVVRGRAALMAPRTIAIDDAIREGSTVRLVILGAWLDARAWRMNELAGTVAFEVDHPATQADKRGRPGAWSDEPHRSHWTPDALSALLAEYGFTTIRDQDLLHISLALGLPRRARDFRGSVPQRTRPRR